MTDQPTDLEQLATSLVSAKEEIEEAKRALDEAKRSYEAIEEKLAEAMEAAGESALKAGERYVSRRATHRWSIPKDHKDTVVQLLKAHRPDLVKETVHTATLNKLAAQMQEPEAAEPWWSEVDGLLSMASTTSVKVTKTKPRT